MCRRSGGVKGDCISEHARNTGLRQRTRKHMKDTLAAKRRAELLTFTEYGRSP